VNSPVRNAPGSTISTFTPNGATSEANVSDQPSRAKPGGAVGAEPGRGDLPADAAQLDHGAAAPAAEVRQGGHGQRHRAVEVHLEQVSQLLLGGLLGRPDLGVPALLTSTSSRP